ncbi:MAG: S8 family serine peptidase [Limisphaera sp.]
MRARPFIWLAASLTLFAASLAIWRWAERARGAVPPASTGAAASSAPQVLDATPRALRLSFGDRLLSSTSSSGPALPSRKELRLRNASHLPETWLRLPTAILLENALVDTAAGQPPAIPPHLQAQGDPGAYIVQRKGELTAAFQAQLRAMNATVVAYIPNNAYLVRASREVAERLRLHPDVQAVLAYEPYYKLRGELLPRAVMRAPLPLGERLHVAVFEDARAQVSEALTGLGARLVAEEPSPFGPVMIVEPPPDRWLDLALLSGVQLLEIATDRVPANDLGRVTLGVAPTPVAPDNWFGLTGTNVLVNVNDSGVDATHPDLAGRMLALRPEDLSDPNGHGTHVIGTIAGTGEMSPTVANASGSPMPAEPGQFRGVAPKARVFVQPVLMEQRPARAGARPILPDSVLQEQAARTNAFISNNSWHYGGNTGYDLAAARYDAATRDALPGVPGSQPLLFVFAAGNFGNGNPSGLGGEADSIRSPGTAKNVITVGSIEQPRQIDAEVVLCRPFDTGTNNIELCVTNTPWREDTDSRDQVAAMSSRGNTGIGVEGEFGRFKPDVVAPGQWVVSTRSQQWDEDAYYNPTNVYGDEFTGLVVPPGEVNRYSVFVPFNAVQLEIELLPHPESPVPFPGLPIFVRAGEFPTAADLAGTNRVSIPPDLTPDLSPRDVSWNIGVGNPTAVAVTFNLRITLRTTNDLGNELEVRRQLNATLAPWYRYESGSSMAAAHVAGTLALMQEFFESRGRTNSPALMKALLINGARSLNPVYDFEVRTLHNYQGWGRVNLPTTLPPALTNTTPPNRGAMILYDQNPTNALVTGDRHLRRLTLTEAARALPLRVTLVWTDPPGNPVAGVKLVNDLDLVVTNVDTGEVYFGNDIPGGSDFNQPWRTNEPPTTDMINNVENVFLAPPLGTNYVVAVIGRRVNVNAVTAHTNNIAQDYALVISSGDGDLEDAITVTELPGASSTNASFAGTTNAFHFTPETTPGVTGMLLLGQRVGANPALLGITNGLPSQWRFYVLTNTQNYTNAAFITFLPHNLSIPRMGVNENEQENATRLEADIDLYVSRNPALTNLDPAALATADKSRGRGGTEILVYSNAAPGGVYYVGVKAEDQMASDFGFLGVFSLLPFSTLEEGNQIVRGFPVPTWIPDGSPAAPGAAYVFGVATFPMQVRRVVVTNALTHQSFGDLVVSLHHENRFAVLRNHTYPAVPPPLTAWTVYEDQGERDIPGAQRTDGPGSLRDFVGEQAAGLWVLQALDDALTQTGAVQHLSLRIEPQRLDETNAWRGIQPFSFFYEVIDVPEDATNLTICVTTTNAPVELYVRHGDFPTRQVYDHFLPVPVPTACLSIGRSSVPPLRAGRYYIGVYNPQPFAQHVQIVVTLDRDPRGIVPLVVTATGETPLLDDAVTNASLLVTNRGRIGSVEVGVRIDHPRVSDLALTLVSPKGTRILLSEARGWASTAGMGSTYLITNIVPVEYSGGAEAVTNVVDLGINQGTVTIDYDFYQLPDRLKVYYEGQLLHDTGMISGAGRIQVDYGPGVSTLLTITVNEGGNPETNTLWKYVLTSIREVHNYLIFTENTNLAPGPIKFIAPPFAPPTNRTETFLGGFESVSPGWYDPGQVVEGWTVLESGPVQVVSNAAWAHTGAQFLALHDGGLARTLATVSGRHYMLQFASRAAPALEGIISWWPGEDDAVDIVNRQNGAFLGTAATRFTNGVVGRAFGFDGSIDAIRVPVSDLLKVRDAITVDAWVYPLAHGAFHDILTRWGAFGLDDRSFGLSLDPLGRPYFVISTNGFDCSPTPCMARATAPLPLRTWTHLAGTYDGQYIRLYVNGALASEVLLPGSIWPGNNDLVIGGEVSNNTLLSSFAGYIDEPTLYGRALTAEEVRAIFEAGARGKCGLPNPPAICGGETRFAAAVAGIVTNVIYNASTNWVTNMLSFQARGPATTIVLESPPQGSRIWLDTFTLTEFPSPMYALPEESLRALTGEEAFGEWKLEIWDMRAGATNVQPVLLSWQLRFVFQNETALPDRLATGQALTNTLPAGQMRFYTVDVPDWAMAATNQLLAATRPLNLWFNQSQPPFGTNAGDYLLLSQVTAGSVTLTPGSVPALQPGTRYYLGVQNTNTNAVTYSLRVDFNITPLTNGVPLYGVEPPGRGPRYFSFVVSPAAAAVVFRLAELTANADLVVRRAPDLPNLLSFDYGSFNPGLADEEIVILTNSAPVPLRPGVWLLGLFNRDTAPAEYTLLAQEQAWARPIITLTNGVPYSSTVPADEVDYYRFVVPADAARAQFEIRQPGADVNLVLRRGWPPATMANFDYLSANPGRSEEYILVLSNSDPVPLAPGEWYVSAVSADGVPASYSVVATAWAVTGRPVVITSVSATATNLCLTWSSLPGARYFVEGVEALDGSSWTPVSSTLTATSTNLQWCIPLPSEYSFFRVVEGIVPEP